MPSRIFRNGFFRSVLLSLALTLLAEGVRADGLIIVRPDPWGGRPRPPLHLQPSRPHAPLEVVRHHVSMSVLDARVEVVVEEVFRNPLGVELEGTYIFPLPPDSTVEDFRVVLGGVELAGEVLERDQARRIYEELVRTTRDPALLEYYDRGLFQARIHPIPAHGDLPVTIRYRQLLRASGDLQRLRYPLDTGRFSAGPYRDVRIVVDVQTSTPLRALASPSHEVLVERRGPRHAVARYVRETDPARTDFLLDILCSRSELAIGVSSFQEPGTPGHFVARLAPGLQPEVVPPRRLVFVMDVSGSMAGDKLVHARAALLAAIERLRPQDRFQILSFATQVRSLAPTLIEASEERRVAARRFVQDLIARGGTDLAGAIEQGLLCAAQAEDGATVLLVTDGAPTVGTTDPTSIVRNAATRAGGDLRLHVFGVGQDVNTQLLDELARKTRGSRSYVGGGDALELALSAALDKVFLPCLTGLVIEADGVTIEAVEPQGPLDVFHGEDLVVTGRYRGQGPTRVSFRGELEGQPRSFVVTADFAAHGGDTGAPALWALQRITRLLGELRGTPLQEQEPLRREIVRLGLRYGVITPFTSFLVREQDAGIISQRLTRRIESSPEAKQATDALGVGFSRASGQDSFDYAAGQQSLEEQARSGSALNLRDHPRWGSFDAGVRFQAGRAFLPDDRQLIEGSLQGDSLPTPDRVLRFGSSEYFDFLHTHPTAGPLLGAGQALLFPWQGEIVQVVPDGGDAPPLPEKPRRIERL